VAWTGSDGDFQEFIDRHGITFPTISDDPGEVFGRFGVPYQPAFAIVTPAGEVQTLVGAADGATLDGIIEQALA
jgi:peroxiredoxin